MVTVYSTYLLTHYLLFIYLLIDYLFHRFVHLQTSVYVVLRVLTHLVCNHNSAKDAKRLKHPCSQRKDNKNPLIISFHCRRNKITPPPSYWTTFCMSSLRREQTNSGKFSITIMNVPSRSRLAVSRLKVKKNLERPRSTGVSGDTRAGPGRAEPPPSPP